MNYDKLWRTMESKGISQYKLINKYNINPSQLHRLRKNQVVMTSTLDRLCDILNCDVGDICEYTYSKKQKKD